MKIIDSLKYIDILNLLLMLIILVIIIFRIRYFHKNELIIWIPSVLGLAFALFLEVNDTLMIGKYSLSAVAITYALGSSTILIQLDKNKKFSLYYTFGLIMLALFTVFTIHFGGTVNSVLTKPMVLTIMLISLCVIIISSIIAVLIKKSNIHILMGALGWTIVGLASLIQWTGIIAVFTLQIIILVGILFLALFFIFEEWDSSKKVKENYIN